MKYSLYSKEIMKHFRKPKNVGIIKNADGKGRVGNLVCGDVMELYIKVKNDKIIEMVGRDIKIIDRKRLDNY